MPLRLLLLCLLLPLAARTEGKPGVILITVDGLGWGDLSAAGNTQVATPQLDRFLADCAVFRDFHVSPLDAPSRAALLTGLDPLQAGVTGCHNGRHRLRAGVTTAASLLRQAGYTTGLFGTWALGDNHPSRPRDHGYTHVLTHPGDGPGGVAGFYSNDGSGDLWLLNGEVTLRPGSNPDVCFGGAITFIEKAAGNPFFCHIAPSLPPSLPEEDLLPFLHKPGISDPRRAAWLTRLDAAAGELLHALDRLGLARDTLVVFTSTTGRHPSPSGNEPSGFNAGRRGSRGSPCEGGHCVPLLVRWPAGGVIPGTRTALSAHVDLLPTLAELTGLPLPPETKPAGLSLAPLLRHPAADLPAGRTLVTSAQEIPVPQPWRQNCVMNGPWRLINGLELYDLRTDPGQRKNLAAAHPETVQQLRAAAEAHWKSVASPLPEPVAITAGGPQDPVLLTPQDWFARGPGPLTRNAVIAGTPANGPWLLHIAEAGEYNILLRRWPLSVDRPVADGFFVPEKARLRAGSLDQSLPVPAGAQGVSFRVSLPGGPLRLQTWFTAPGKSCGAYFVEIRRAGPAAPPPP